MRSVSNSLLFINFQDGRKQRVVLAQNQSMVEILQHLPGCFFDLITGEDHIDALFNRVLHLNGKDAGVAVKMMCSPFVFFMCFIWKGQAVPFYAAAPRD